MTKAGAPGREEVVRVVVSVDDAFVDDEQVRKAVLSEIERAGLKVSKVMDRIGVVTGSVSSQKLSLLQAIEHVLSVETDERRSTQSS